MQHEKCSESGSTDKINSYQLPFVYFQLIKRFAGTQRLGRGKFEPCEKSVLLTEELPGSLRELKPQVYFVQLLP